MNTEKFTLWPPNALPIPVISEEAEHEPKKPVSVDMSDNFPKGEIIKFFTHQGYGFMKDRVGRQIYFNVAEMDFVGLKGKDALSEGLTVGYDLSYTDKGLHVKKMKVY